jgi:hypothetical protein
MKANYWSGSMERTGEVIETRDDMALIVDDLSGEEIWIEWIYVFPMKQA